MQPVDRFPSFVTDLPEVELPYAGARAWIVQSDRNQVVFAQFDQPVAVPEHSHREQWEIVLSGSLMLRMNDETREYRTGDTFFVPAGTPHAADVRAGYRAVIVFNEPARYRVK